MSDTANTITLKAGQILFNAGDPGDCAYLIKKGRVGIEILRDGYQVEIAQLGRGQVIGEMAIIDGMPRSASVRAIEPTVLLVVTADQLKRRIDAADPIVKACLQTLLGRMRATLGLVGATPGRSLLANQNPHPDSPFEASVEELRLEQELMEALEREELRLHYQPIVHLGTGRLTAFEALMRWQHPERGLIPPVMFIPQAEASGMIIPMTEWAMREASWSLQSFELSRCLNSDAVERTQLTVNISAIQLLHEDFISNICGFAEIFDKDVERLSLEITESVLVACPEEAATRLKFCRDMGFGISIDDFGTGYSSLSYLSKLPVTRLKLDRSFVRNLDESEVNRKIVQCIVGMSQGLELPIIAEGVERPQEAVALAELGCEQAQGFYFGRPLDSTETLRLIKTWKTTDVLNPETYRAVASY